MSMSEVKKCDVNECFYNEGNMCHASAILVGSPHPSCDTFISSGNHASPAKRGSVGACHVSDCEYNTNLSCNASGIDVGYHEAHADCMTYERRSR